VDFATAITVIIARPLTAPWRVADGLVTTTSGREVLIGCPLIGGDNRVAAGMAHNEWFKRGTIGVFAEA
jgi:hypothetical protein